MMNTFKLFPIVIITSLMSCATSKVEIEQVKLLEKTKIVKIEEIKGEKLVSLYMLTDHVDVELLITEKSIRINVEDEAIIDKLKPLKATLDKSLVKDLKIDKYYRFPFQYQYNGSLKNSILRNELYSSQNDRGLHWEGQKIEYIDIMWLKQAITFPFKYRHDINNNERQKFLNYQISTSFNAGFLFGGKFLNKSIKPVYNIENNQLVNIETTKNGFSGGLFAGFTTIPFDDNNTYNDLALGEKRTVFGVTYGIACLVTLNNFTVGASVGLDSPIGLNGEEKANWVYYKKPWIGLTLGFDVLK